MMFKYINIFFNVSYFNPNNFFSINLFFFTKIFYYFSKIMKNLVYLINFKKLKNISINNIFFNINFISIFWYMLFLNTCSVFVFIFLCLK